jgi:hypothetical protein
MEKSTEQTDEDLKDFNRRFKYAMIAYAVIEFVVIVFVIYYNTYR